MVLRWASIGLARAARVDVATTCEGVEGLLRLPVCKAVDLVFDAASAGAPRYRETCAT